MTTDINVWREERRINREMAFDETEISGGKAVILMNQHEISQFRMWVTSEKKYVRESLKTRDKALGIVLLKARFMLLATSYNKVKRYLVLQLMKRVMNF